jgi:hypothetical protein
MATCTVPHHPNHAHQHCRTAGTRLCAIVAMSITCTTAICITCTKATSTSTLSRSAAPIRRAAHPRPGAYTHGLTCGHERVPHGDHVDYLVDWRLHHPHDGHCDDHEPVELAT